MLRMFPAQQGFKTKCAARDRTDNGLKVQGEFITLKGAPHTAEAVVADTWDQPYGREQAAYPAPWLREAKFWPPVARIDNAYGDRHLVCACPPLEEYAD